MFVQDIIKKLKEFWSTNAGCAVCESFDMQVGAGTLSPMTAIDSLKREEHNICYVQLSRRPSDGRFAINPNRMSRFMQFQVILKPAPLDIQKMCEMSIQHIGIDTQKSEIRFIEDNWENPSIRATGVGYEMWCNGMEILQYTYMQKLGGIKINPVPIELAYGIERIAMYTQDVDHYNQLMWNKDTMYTDIMSNDHEKQFSDYYQNFHFDTEDLVTTYEISKKNANKLLDSNSYYVVYEKCLEMSNILNILDARNAISSTRKQEMIIEIGHLVNLALKSIQ